MFIFVTSKVFKTFLPNETLLDINFLSIFLLIISIGCSEYWKLFFLILISQSIIFLLNFYTIHNKRIKSLFVCCNSFFEILSVFLYFFLTYFCVSFFRILFLYHFLHYILLYIYFGLAFATFLYFFDNIHFLILYHIVDDNDFVIFTLFLW